MGVDASVSPVDRIGEAAGMLWHYLDSAGTVNLSKLIEDLDVPRDLLMQAIGWLAREDKLQLVESKRRKTISLKR
jgi:hypothetical protein